MVEARWLGFVELEVQYKTVPNPKKSHFVLYMLWSGRVVGSWSHGLTVTPLCVSLLAIIHLSSAYRGSCGLCLSFGVEALGRRYHFSG